MSQIVEKILGGFCVCCGVQRINGWLRHDKECIWKDAADYNGIKNGERTIIFAPYLPKEITSQNFDTKAQLAIEGTKISKDYPITTLKLWHPFAAGI